MTTVLVSSCGGSPGIDMARCLRQDPTLRIVGADASPWGRRLGERFCDEVVSLPSAGADAGAYVDALCEAAAGVDFVFVGLDLEVAALSQVGRPLPVPSALAPLPVLDLLLDKARTQAAGAGSGAFPATRTFRDPAQLEAIFEALGSPLWIRPCVGTSGKGSLAAADATEARRWLAAWGASGEPWMAQTLLPGRNFNWSAVFVEGQRVACASMERLSYLLADLVPTGVTGQVKLCSTVREPEVDAVAERAVRAIDDRPHGVYSVDLRGDADGAPRVTENQPPSRRAPLALRPRGGEPAPGGAPGPAGRGGGGRRGSGRAPSRPPHVPPIDVEPLIAEAPGA